MKANHRTFLKYASLSGAALILGVPAQAGTSATEQAAAPTMFQPNQWLALDETGTVTIVVGKCEMGQGVRTALPMMVAEEMEIDLHQVKVVTASPGPKYDDMGTGGSDSVISGWKPLRIAGAAAREMLLAAAAAHWKVDRTNCLAKNGSVRHQPSNRTMKYAELVSAAAKLPVPENPPLKDPKQFTLIGTRVNRVDGPQIVTGKAVYGQDVRVPGMKVAVVARPPVIGGKLVSFDAKATKTVPGVSEVVQIPSGVAVIADSTWNALKGREALSIIWDKGPLANLDSAKLYSLLEEGLKKGGRVTRSAGDAAKAMKQADKKLEATYVTPFQAHAAVEPLNCVVHVTKDACHIKAGTQSPNSVQKSVAKLLNLAPEAVTVEVELIGGGFGRRLGSDFILEGVEIARKVPFPVQLVWTRQDDIQHDYFHTGAINQLSVGLDAQNQPLAWTHRTTDFHLSMFGPFDPKSDDTYEESPWGAYDTPYTFANLLVEYAPVESPVPTGAWRAVYYPPNVFARESFLDEVAHAIGKDPLQLRLDLLPKEVLTLGRRKINLQRLRTVLELVAEKAGWGKPLPTAKDRKWGRGIACNLYHGRTVVAQVAEVSVDSNHRLTVHKITCAVDCGQVINLSGLEGQIESGITWGLTYALRSQITFKNGAPEQDSYLSFPVIRLSEMPEIEVHVVPSTEIPSGLGEQPVPPVAPAVMNAYFQATGKRIRKLPFGS
ncbi:MAG: molybdopterin-dependent oxidoreductase [Blastocatellia bacterium]|nr:molybdopterin-dependent oxidoreductase [Blastocatellia bacterium]